MTTRLACGAAAETVGQTVAYPIDVIHRRIQSLKNLLVLAPSEPPLAVGTSAASPNDLKAIELSVNNLLSPACHLRRHRSAETPLEGASSGAATYALNASTLQVAAVNLHDYIAGFDNPSKLKKEDIEAIAKEYGINEQDKAFKAKIGVNRGQKSDNNVVLEGTDNKVDCGSRESSKSRMDVNPRGKKALFNKLMNADIEKGNKARQQCARVLELPDISLRQKVAVPAARTDTTDSINR
ncbi:hypothetical protein SESBI_49424, partial [Sesbania bispinosa]